MYAAYDELVARMVIYFFFRPVVLIMQELILTLRKRRYLQPAVFSVSFNSLSSLLFLQ